MALLPDQIGELLVQVAQRDRSAFSALYDATSSKLYGIVFRIMRRRDLTDEVVQEVYVKIWERAADYSAERGAPMTWMAAIARNRALDEVRKKQHVSIEDRPDVMELASDEPHPLANLEASQDARRLRACLDTLEPQRRDLVVRAYFDGMSREELASKFGSPVGTIKTWLHRALAQLKACLST